MQTYLVYSFIGLNGTFFRPQPHLIGLSNEDLAWRVAADLNEKARRLTISKGLPPRYYDVREEGAPIPDQPSYL